MGLEERSRKARKMILESETVASALEPNAAEMLLDWALAQAERYAYSSKDMEEREAMEHIAHGVAKVRRLMGMVNDLVEDRDYLTSVEMAERLIHLLSVAVEGQGRVAK